MKNSTEYYQNTINVNKPSLLLSRFFKLKFTKKLKGNTAVELGCGAGNDTMFLLDKGFKVTAIDNNPQVKDILLKRAENNKNLEVIIDDFSKVQLNKTDLILANFSLFFVKNGFDTLLKNVLQNINKEGFFCRKLPWKRR